MLKRKGRPKKPKNVIMQIETSAASTETVADIQIKYKCDNPKCPSEAVAHIDAHYCKLCAQDKGFSIEDDR